MLTNTSFVILANFMLSPTLFLSKILQTQTNIITDMSLFFFKCILFCNAFFLLCDLLKSTECYFWGIEANIRSKCDNLVKLAKSRCVQRSFDFCLELLLRFLFLGLFFLFRHPFLFEELENGSHDDLRKIIDSHYGDT